MNNLIPFPKSAGKWFDFRNVKDDSVDLYIYDVVGDSWVGTDAAALVKEIVGHKKKRINTRINSPGGSVFDGVAIYNALKNHDGGVTTYIDGLAASIASIIALAGDKIVMADNAMMMIHNPSSFSWGEASQLRKDADILDQIKETLINTYANKTGKARDVIAADMDKETWFTAQESLAYGLVTEVTGAMKLAACVDSEIAAVFGYRNPPSGIVAAVNTTPTTISAMPRSLLERRQALLEQ